MRPIYINLHPDYDYAIAIAPQRAFMSDYLSSVSWLQSAVYPQIYISGSKENLKENHLLRTKVFAQRMIQAGKTVLVRDKRDDPWTEYTDCPFTENEMLAVELQRFSGKPTPLGVGWIAFK